MAGFEVTTEAKFSVFHGGSFSARIPPALAWRTAAGGCVELSPLSA